jgi:hypothetical protein
MVWKHVGVGALSAVACFGASPSAAADDSPPLLVNPWTQDPSETVYEALDGPERAAWLEAPVVQSAPMPGFEELIDPWQERTAFVPTGTFPPVDVVDPWSGARLPRAEE